jgi:hypothetical protein
MQRVFTYNDLAAFFNSLWGKHAEPRYELLSISLLPDILPGAWRVEYTASYQDGHVVSCNCVVLQLARKDGTQYLNLPEYVNLPIGMASVEDECIEIERTRIAGHERRT